MPLSPIEITDLFILQYSYVRYLEILFHHWQKFRHFFWRSSWHQSRLRTPALMFLPFLQCFFLSYLKVGESHAGFIFIFILCVAKQRHIILYFLFSSQTSLNINFHSPAWYLPGVLERNKGFHTWTWVESSLALSIYY